MKTRIFQNSLVTLTIAAALAFAAGTVSAQDAGAAQTAPPLSYGVTQIIQLAKANISEDTILNFVHNSGNNYGLDADQIVYLKQQGISANVINAMLNQHNSNAPAQPAPSASSPDNNYTATAQPAATYVQPAPDYAPASSVYVIPDTQTYNYYAGYYTPYYAGYYGYGWPAVSLSFGWGGGYYGGYRGGYSGGWHGGGGFRGGGFHGGWHR